ncbi:hypothetical protein EJ03DRAFT_338153 [Teratosphaeria nubilosa]|uniref:Uncharacterized protein n=1 Tax=Teratosphaeria nubilosa TaxID=161662 RepID=A0A6G1L1W4_9PEZI|nr:hypothetical protein EJ03DRAFT_338153 [Teratosphaeria nubilosa]
MNSPVLYHPILGQYVVLAEDRRGRSFKLLELGKSYFTPQDVNKVAQQWSKVPALSHLSADDIIRHMKEISHSTTPATSEDFHMMKEEVKEVRQSCAVASMSVGELAREVDLLKLVVQQKDEIERLRSECIKLKASNAKMMSQGGSTQVHRCGEGVPDESFVTAQTSSND